MGKKTRRGRRHRDFPELPADAKLHEFYHRLSPDHVTNDVRAAIAARQAGVPSRPIVKLGNARIVPVPSWPNESNTPPNT